MRGYMPEVFITADQGVVVSGWKATFRNDGTIQGGNFGGSIKGEGFEFANFGLITANTAV
jgi:hypothetical protein